MDALLPPRWNASLSRLDKGADAQFQEWNGHSVAEGVARLNILDQKRVGAILLVGQGETGAPFITVLGAPTITMVDLTEADAFGAPEWQTQTGRSNVSHAVVASAGWQTRTDIPLDRRSLETTCAPVLMTKGDDFMSRANGSFKVLFLPDFCDPPVGLYWPVEVTYESFCESLRSRRFFTGFSQLLQKQEQIFRTWFGNVASHTADMVVQPMEDARPFWDNLTARTINSSGSVSTSGDTPGSVTTARTTYSSNSGKPMRETSSSKSTARMTYSSNSARALGDTSSSVKTAKTIEDRNMFLVQRSRFLWCLFCDSIRNGASTEERNYTIRTAFDCYLEAVRTVYPGWEHLPSSELPFVPDMCPLTTAWPYEFGIKCHMGVVVKGGRAPTVVEGRIQSYDNDY